MTKKRNQTRKTHLTLTPGSSCRVAARTPAMPLSQQYQVFQSTEFVVLVFDKKREREKASELESVNYYYYYYYYSY